MKGPRGTPTLRAQEPRVSQAALPHRDEPVSDAPAPGAPAKRNLMDRADTYLSRLSTRNNFWHRLFSLIWLPYAFKSGIRMKRIDAKTFSAVLPFRRFNRNWYNAMAGAALLANSEVAGGMYVFGTCGGEYTVVCKNLEYRFLRPCFGPALYRISPREDVDALKASRSEFNITLDLDIVQQIGARGGKERRVGKCVATFHVTPKTHQKKKGRRTRPGE
jgi:acyl-coenzyme A thioesterase PaaI-like protein